MAWTANGFRHPSVFGRLEESKVPCFGDPSGLHRLGVCEFPVMFDKMEICKKHQLEYYFFFEYSVFLCSLRKCRVHAYVRWQ